jgi:hypothetical protein
MIALFWLFLALSVSPFKSKNRLAAENAALRHQLIVLQRRVRGRVQLANGDRLLLVTLYRWFPSVLKAITIVRPETLVRWHRAGFRRYWRWKSPHPLSRKPERSPGPLRLAETRPVGKARVPAKLTRVRQLMDGSIRYLPRPLGRVGPHGAPLTPVSRALRQAAPASCGGSRKPRL